MKEGWKYVKLEDIATNMFRGSGIKRDQVTSEGYPCIRYGEIYTTYNIAFEKCMSHTIESIIPSPKYIEPGDILFAITGESVEEIGKSIAYVGKSKCLVGGDIAVMQHKQNPKYLAYALSSPNAVMQKGLGKTKLKVVHTNIPSLKEIKIPLPSLSEQQHIVTFLDTEFAKIDALKAKAEQSLQNAKDLFQAALKEMMEPKEGIKIVRLYEVCDFQNGFAFKSNLFSTSGSPIIRISDIQNESVDDSALVYFDLSSYQINLDRYKVFPGDILIAMSGGTTGKIGINKTNREYYLNQRVGVFREKKEKLHHMYLYFFLHTKSEESLKIAAGAAQPNLSTAQIKDFRIPLPPLDEQESIADKLSYISNNIQRLQSNYIRTLQLCADLKQSLLKQVFE